jgi:osmoprotectant transport system ATP-binding protein
MADSAVPILSADDVRKAYGSSVALESATLAVGRGECVALVGESGSGKTTLLRCFNRMVQPDAGVVRVDGVDVRERDPVELRRGIGYVQQEGGLLPHWTVLRNASLVPWLRGEAAEERGRAALERVGLPAPAFGGRWPRELSGGQRQRVAIARALAADPAIILLDEPFGALDAITRSDVQKMFLEVRGELGLTALLVTHDLHEAFQLADRVAVMHRGRIEQIGRPESLVRAPATEYVARLLHLARVA